MPKSTCSVEGCGRQADCRGWCHKHHEHWRKYGDPIPSPPSIEERFWAKVRKTAGCWVWTGAKISSGYGEMSVKGKPQYAHRLAYELLVGPIPDGLVIDHLCRNTSCVNPAHLEVVTERVNILRGSGATAVHARATHCPQGHPYDEANTYRSKGHRKCRTCALAREKVAYQADRVNRAAKERARQALRRAQKEGDSEHTV